MPLAQPFDTPYAQALTAAFDARRYAEMAAHARLLLLQFPEGAFYWKAFGAALLRLEQARTAVDAIGRALSIDPHDSVAWTLLGVAMQARGQSALALESHARAIALELQDPGAYLNHGLTLAAIGRATDSITSYARALSVEPTNVAAWVGSGHAARAVGASAAATNAYLHAICLAPASVESIGSYGLLRREDGDFELARRCFCRVLGLRPASSEALNNLGATLRDLECYREAFDSYAAAVVQQPGFSEALTNLGTALMELRLIAESVRFFDRAHSVDPTNFSAPWNASLGCLSIGEFARGWALHEQRFAARAIIDPRLVGLPVFSGGTGKHERILVCGEQGIGDEVMFGSMIGDFRSLAGKLAVRIDPRLLPLFRRSLPSDIAVVGNNVRIERADFDAQIPMGSLGLHVRSNPAAFARTAWGYLRTDTDREQRMRGLLAPSHGAPLVGVSWRSTNAASSARRSIDLGRACRMVADLLPSARFVSLQYGDTDGEIRAANRQYGVEVLRCPGVDVTHDLDSVAALIGACDAVLTIGNATAHLCGAIGKPAAVLLPFAPSWRWMAEGSRTPWYASLELFRKDTPVTPWDDVIAAAATFLADRFRSASGGTGLGTSL